MLCTLLVLEEAVAIPCTGISASLSNTECIAWQRFYDATQGERWTACSSHRGNPCECNASYEAYVTCSGGHITEIKLDNSGLGGTLPTEIGDFVKLTMLSAATMPNYEAKNAGTKDDSHTRSGRVFGRRDNRVASLPPPPLQRDNQISGTIPDSIGRLSQLQLLYLDSNQLSGSIPSSIGNLSKLVDLYLLNQSLTGPLPAELAQCTQLESLWIMWNQLSGAVPGALNWKALSQGGCMICLPGSQHVAHHNKVSCPMPQNAWRQWRRATRLERKARQ